MGLLMPKAVERLRRFAPLRRVSDRENAVRLSSPRASVEISVLAEDLFRLRISLGKTFSTAPSWAVLPRPAPAGKTTMAFARGVIGLETEAAKFSVRLADGTWQFHDRTGEPIFSSESGRSGFQGRAPRLALTLREEDQIFGLGETAGAFNKRGLVREFWNVDVLGVASAIHPGLRSMYLSIPFGILLRGQRAGGLFWDNPRRQKWDLGQTVLDQWTMAAAGGEVDLYLVAGPQLPSILDRYTELTGRMPLPPRWALGYHQSRYSYQTRQRVEAVAETFRRKKIPCDAIYLDIDHMDRYRVFTFGRAFPAPAEMLRQLRRKGFKVVAIVDPGVKNDPRFPVLRRGVACRAFVRNAGGRRDYVGKVWPGPSRFPDFTNAGVRSWWSGEQSRFQRSGLAGFWNDMNEPSNFALPSKTLPEDCLHFSDMGRVHHGAVHNIYGMQMARASREGALEFAPDRRPFVISRAGYAGLQRYALVWTGDNSSNWEHLAESVGMLLNLSLSGVAFCGADVGGFLDSATGELLARWTQLAAFTPFFRNHANNESRDQEPWIFGKQVEAICRKYIEMRYRLLPFIYGLFRQSQLLGAPIIRPLFWSDPADAIGRQVDDQFLLGNDLLVAPVLRAGGRARQVYLPAGTWHDFWTGRKHVGRQHVLAEADLATIPLFARAGALIPFAPVTQFIGGPQPSEMTLEIWDGAPGRLDWYEDDGETLDYERGGFHQRVIVLKMVKGKRRLQFGAAEGSYPSDIRRWRVVLHRVEPPRNLRVSGSRARWKKAGGSFAFEISNETGPFEATWS